MSSEYSVTKIGSKYSESFKAYITCNKKIISPFHDIPYRNGKYITCVNEISRFEHAKFEISKEDGFNPIKQDIKKGKVRFVKNVFPMFGYPFNYGAIPQTWEDPKHKDDEMNAFGDNDPVDVIEVGKKRKELGEVYSGKVLGAYALLDDGEADWKVLVIDSADNLADKINSVNDIEKYMPGLLKTVHTWLRDYKLPDEKPENQFAFEGRFLDAEKAIEVIEKMHCNWKSLIMKGHEKISIQNASVKDSAEYSDKNFEISGKAENDSEVPDYLQFYSYVTKQ